MPFDATANVIEVSVRRLRRKLDDPYQPKLLHTVRGLGYVLELRCRVPLPSGHCRARCAIRAAPSSDPPLCQEACVPGSQAGRGEVDRSGAGQRGGVFR
jgi:hypothetical protein